MLADLVLENERGVGRFADQSRCLLATAVADEP
jgi:hypothetical protein